MNTTYEHTKRLAQQTITTLRLTIALLLMLTLGSTSVWGQTDYSGVWYIGSVGYNAETPASNYYLCPTEGWCYYQATDDFTGTSNGMPFLTTYQCRSAAYHSGNPNDAIWIIEKKTGTDYYYIKQASSTNRYLTSNGTIRTTNNADRMRIHLEAVDTEDLGDKQLFTIASYSTYLTISPKGVVGGAADRKWLTVNNGNNPSLKGESGKTGGPTGYTNTTGIIGVYTQNDANAKFYLENALSIDAPTITNNFNGTITITAAEGATIYYTTNGDTPTTSSSVYSTAITLTDDITVIKAIAKASSDPFPTIVTTYNLPKCEKPTISVSGGTVTITCATEGATIHYTTDGNPVISTSTVYTGPFVKGSISTVRAVATKVGYITSSEAVLMPPTEVSSSSQITNMSGNYILAEGFTSSAAIGSPSDPFVGTIDGNYKAFSLSGHALIDVADGATIKNIMISSASIDGSGDVGAIVNTATGDTKIYNCGVLSGSVSGDNAGGLVGHINSGSSVRVVNCYNYADVSGDDYAAGIVGYNEGIPGDVRIALCMMYGTVSGNDKISPVYAGNHVSNVQNFTEYNYYLYSIEKDATGQKVIRIPYTDYNDQLAIENEEFLTRYPFYRHILNNHRELASYFLFGDYDSNHIEELGHWVRKKGTNDPKYPIIEKWEVNRKSTPTKEKNNLPNTDLDYAGKLLTNMGDATYKGYLKVSITIDSDKYTEYLPITDMDTLRYDYNYGKVILPFANEYKINTDYSRICTGWKITSVSGGTAGSFANYNFADRDCTAKDIYNETTNPFIYAQGGYYIVPTGVTGISIEANFATAYYLSDATYEIGYTSAYAGRTGLGGDVPTQFHGRTVYNSLATAVTNLATSTTNPHKQAIVLVGNYHYDLAKTALATGQGFTLMSIDEDNNQEPDYGFYSIAPDRPQTPALRFDFVPIVSLGMAAKVNGSYYYPGVPIWKPRGWYEQTETTVSMMNQFELDSGNFTYAENGKGQNPCIINGGYFVQMIRSNVGNCSKVSYFKIGGNAHIKEFFPGSHSKNAKSTTVVPVNVTGGQVDECYMTGYNSSAKAIGTDIRFWCSGGKIGKFLGAYMDKPQQTSGNVGNVNMTAHVDHALIGRFFGGGTSPNATITGDINVTINNSKVDFYCGGPEFGDMIEGKVVETNATNTTFGEYYGAGFGGTAITYSPVDGSQTIGASVTFPSDKYTYGTDRLTNSGSLGLATCYKFEYLVHSATKTLLVPRFITGYANFNLATTGNVTNNLTGCTIEKDFYGAGCQGKVNGTVTSTLTSCELKRNVFGGGYKAENNTVKVYPTDAPTLSVYNGETGIFSEFGTTTPVTFTWEQGTGANPVADEDHLKLKTSNGVTMTELGNVMKAISLTIDGGSVDGAVFGGGNESKSLDNTTVVIQNGTTIGRSVYGGGNLADVNGNTSVTVTGGTIGTANEGGAEYGNVFGGGKGKADDVTAGIVKGSTNVSISGSPTILHNVYGGGAYGSVGTFSYDASGFPTGWTTTDNKGKCTVTITGGTIGSTGDNNGMVFGSSRGLEGDPSIPNVDKMAWVYDTEVTIGPQNAQSNATPWIKGSVYGGGENGHNFHDASVTVHSGTIGITEGTAIVNDGGTPDDTSDDISYSGARFPNRGNVYGAGCGTDTYTGTDSKTYFDFNAGIVRGNTTVQINGGHVVHNVYGGGAMGSVGTYTFDANGKPISCAEGTGTCIVTVSGGQIGVAGATMAGHGKGGPDNYGHVFGAGRGEMHAPNLYPNLEKCAYFNKTLLTISGTAFLTGSAYGGSESGHVLGDTEVTISGGQIGCGREATEPYGTDVWADNYVPTASVNLDCASWPFEAPFASYDPNANETGDLDMYPNGGSTDGGRLEASDGHTYYGNVFGGGSGSVPYFDETAGISKYLSTAGSVEGNTKVTISGGHVITNVYGGCEATNVKGSATIKMTGGTVGVPRTVVQIVAHPLTGYIFGAGKGDQRIFFNKETNVDRTEVTIEGGRVYGSIFGGGEDGHVFQNTTVTIGKDDGTGPTIGTKGTSYVDGNVFGGGRGFSGEALTAGNVGGSVELNIKGGRVLGSVYGGGRLASVGYGLYLVDEEITEDTETIKPYGILRPNDKYDGSYPNPSTEEASTYYNKGRGYIEINISGGTIGNDYEYIYNPTQVQKAAIPNTSFDYQNHLQYTKGGNVFTGGMGRLYALDNTTLLPLWPKLGKCKGTTLNMTGGTVKSSIYGGGEIGAVAENATVNVNGGTVGTKVVDPEDATKYYYFGSVFGGGKGSVDNITYPSTTPEADKIPISEAGTTQGNVEVNLNKTVASNDEATGAIVHQVFGCNDMNGSPKGTVTVHVYATQNADKANISSKPDKDTDTYDVMAVYGGGNLAAYEPEGGKNTTKSTSVIIDGCGLTSIRQVYGGGNAASTPATNVVVNGTYEILELFGGGNGFDKLPDGRPNPGANVGYKNYTIYEKVNDEWVAKDDPAYDTKDERTAGNSAITYGTGQASINVFGGTVHRVFGGSNTKGNVRQTAVTLLDENSGCAFCVDEAYGGGKSAPMDAEAKLLMACIPGLKAAYGGAEAAAIQGNVTLNITNGTFDRVFGGNNLSGTINGSITVNVEEVGCKPIKIGELYGGGNQAGYSVNGYNADGTPKESGTKLYEDPQVNVKSFTSIGKVFGGGYGSGATMVGNPTVNINEVYGKYYNEDVSVVGEGAKTNPNGYSIPSHAKGKMGAISEIFGGGNAAKVIGNTTVNIATQEEVFVVKQVSVGDALTGLYTRSGAGTDASPYVYTAASGTAEEHVTYYEKKEVLGVDIRGNVYGGGNNAEVTGNTNVNIGKKNN